MTNHSATATIRFYRHPVPRPPQSFPYGAILSMENSTGALKSRTHPVQVLGFEPPLFPGRRCWCYTTCSVMGLPIVASAYRPFPAALSERPLRSILPPDAGIKMTILNVLGDTFDLTPPFAAFHSTALAFAFDSGYLMPFKTMIASMALTKTMPLAPIYVFSDDAAVFQDPFVRAAADHQILIEGQIKDTLYDLAENHVRRSERASWNRGTFLKWAVFRDYPEHQVLFLDVDMVCLQPIEPLLSMEPNADLIGCPQFQRSVKYDINGKKQPSPVIAANLRGMLDGTARKLMYRLNSGVMLARKPLLNDSFRDQLVAFARGGIEINEQSHITKFFARSSPTLKLISSQYNFHESYLTEIESKVRDEILRDIKILHFPGNEKPWKCNPGLDLRPSLRCWWNANAALKGDA
jgi:lipopolysaccharide biosynthesis glycosyltransferase